MEQIYFALVTYCGLRDQISVTVSVPFAGEACGLCLLFREVTHQAILRSDILGDARNCLHLERETCSGAQ